MRMKELMERSRKVGFVTNFLPSKQTSTMSKVLRRIGLREFLTLRRSTGKFPEDHELVVALRRCRLLRWSAVSF